MQKQLNNQFENFIIIKISPYRKIWAYFVGVKSCNKNIKLLKYLMRWITVKSVNQKRYISLIIVIFFVLGMCSENLRTDSSFEYTNTGQQEIIGISDSKLSQYEIIQGIIQSIRLKARQNYRLRLLASIRNDFVQSHIYITESVLIKLLSGIIFSSITVVSYIHAKDGEK